MPSLKRRYKPIVLAILALFLVLSGFGFYHSIIDSNRNSLLGLMMNSMGIEPNTEYTGAQKENEGVPEQGKYALHTYPLQTLPTQPVQTALNWSKTHISDAIPAGADKNYQPAYLDSGVALSSTTWTSFGPRPENEYPKNQLVSGRVTALAVDNVGGTTVYAGMADGGVWKSTDCCYSDTSFTPTTEDPLIATAAIGSLAVDPNNHNVIYAGTGESNYCSNCLGSRGVLKSSNGGASWSSLGSSFIMSYPLSIGSLVVDPRNSNTVVAGTTIYPVPNAPTTTVGIYISANGGSSWNKCLIPYTVAPAGYPQDISDITLDSSTNPTNIYVAVGLPIYNAANGIYKTFLPLNGSCPTTWTRILQPSSSFFGGKSFGRIQMDVARSDLNTLYATVAYTDAATILGVVRTNDRGANWQVTSTIDNFYHCGNMYQSFYNLYLKIDPVISTTVYVGYINLYKSTDGGTSFTDVICGTPLQAVPNNHLYPIHEDQHALAFLGVNQYGTSNIVIGNDGGIWGFDWTSVPPWVSSNQTISSIQFYGGDLTPNFANDNNAKAFGGSQDNGTSVYAASSSKPYQWEENSLGGDGGYTAIEPLQRQRWYAFFPGSSPINNLNCSTNGGGVNSFNPCYGGWVAANESTGFVAPFVLDHLNCGSTCQHMVFGSNHVWESLDGATTWASISPTLTKTFTGYNYIRALAFAPNDTTVVYAGTSDGNVWYTPSAGYGGMDVWINITGGNAAMPNRSVSSITVSPVDKYTAYVAFDGFDANTPSTKGHVYKVNIPSCPPTPCSPAVWTNLSGKLPDIPVYAIAVNPLNAQQVFIGSEIGFYFTDNINASPPVWNRFQTGLPVTAINQLTIDRGNTTLAAWTNGRGMYAVALPSLSWQRVSSPNGAGASNVLNAVTAADANNVWAVGQSDAAALIEKWNGSSWITVTNPITINSGAKLYGVKARTSSDVWTVGTAGTALAAHYISPTWSLSAAPSYSYVTTLLDVAPISSNSAWAVGYNDDPIPGGGRDKLLIERWTGGSTWQGVITTTNVVTVGSNQLRGIVAINGSDIWAVGYYCTDDFCYAQQRTLTEHWNGSSWTIVPSPNIGSFSLLNSVTAISSNDVWAVGYYVDPATGVNLPLTMHWGGSSWSIVATPTSQLDGPIHPTGILYSVRAISANDVWTVGCQNAYCSATLTLHWDGVNWGYYGSDNPTNGGRFYGLATVTHRDAWAVGNDGLNTLIERWNPAPNWWP